VNSQTDKLKLLALTFEKVAVDKQFIAYHLQQFRFIENKTATELSDYLDCSAEQIYKLGLSKVPLTTEPDYVKRLSAICDYIGIRVTTLNHLLQVVAQYEHQATKLEQKTLEDLLFAGWGNSSNRMIHTAAKTINRVETYLGSWLTKIPTNIYKGGFTILCLVFFVFLSTTKVDDKALYIATAAEKMNQYRYIAAADNTYVHITTLKKV
jgi:hypothetical protein